MRVREPGPESRRSPFLRDLAKPANLTSLGRILLIWLSAVLFLHDMLMGGIVAGFLAGVSDYLDGWIARRRNEATELGAVLDRMSDLVFESTAFVVIMHFGVLSPVFFIVYMARETVVLSVRLYCGVHTITVPSSIFGKLKTNFLGYGFLLLYLSMAPFLSAQAAATCRGIGLVLVSLGLVWSFVSGTQYMRAFVSAYDRQRAG